MFIGVFRPTTIFHSFGDVIIIDEVLKFSPKLGIHCHWAVTVLNVQHVLWHGLTLYLFFVLFGVLQLENFLLIKRRHHYRWMGSNFDLQSALAAIEQWGFFSVPHLLGHGASVYNGHIRGLVTLTPVSELSSGAVTICFNDLCLSRPGIEPWFPSC